MKTRKLQEAEARYKELTTQASWVVETVTGHCPIR